MQQQTSEAMKWMDEVATEEEGWTMEELQTELEGLDGQYEALYKSFQE